MARNTYQYKKNQGALILLLVVTALIIIETACNQNSATKSFAPSAPFSMPSCDSNWLILDVKFKTAVNKETRDGVAQVIAQYLIDTITTIKAGGYPNYKPSLSIKTFAFQDTLLYQFKISGHTDYGGYAVTDTSAGPTPPCKCPSCGVCPKINTLIFKGDPLSIFVDAVTTQ